MADGQRLLREVLEDNLRLFHGPVRRLLIAKWLVVAGLASGLALCPRVWLSDREYPLVPLIEALPPIPPPWDVVGYWLLLLLVVLAGVLPRPGIAIAAAIAVATIGCVFDQNRLQPWVYEYGLLLVALATVPWGRFALAKASAPNRAEDALVSAEDQDRAATALRMAQIIVAALYTWSGIQKLNLGFVENVFPSMVEPITGWMPASARAAVHAVGYAAPFIELSLGLGLFIPRTRRIAVFGIIAMHAFNMLALGPWGRDYNSVVWPWNIAMALVVVTLFGNTRNAVFTPIFRRGWVLAKVIAVLTLVMPAFGLLGWWDAYLSASLYSGNNALAAIAVTPWAARQLPPSAMETLTQRRDGAYNLRLLQWALRDMNVPAYPEERAHRQAARAVMERYSLPPSDVALIVISMHGPFEARGQEKVFRPPF